MLKVEQGMPPALLWELLLLDVERGLLYWRERSVAHFTPTATRTAEHMAKLWNNRYAGMPALGSRDASGHLTGRIFGQLVYAHRVVFAMVHGQWPTLSVDHINGGPADNRPSNLRDVAHIENHRNQRLRKNNTSGVLGVSFNKRLGKWSAHITLKGTYTHLGFHESKDAAIAARKTAEAEYGFHENHGRSDR